ncbi:methylosome subunit pICln [Thrips palmi]|uniref:Methylosome subunit pICln n=1 Tax=Thrips palmi TaxID=161013 RepID=A0A6P9A3A0_THRPL|nr:methylosome subunit pICln [Thrips palmi]
MVVLSTFPPPAEGVRHQQINTEVLMNDRSLGKGTLYIAESRVSWVNSASGEGFSLEYPHICLHAISRTPVECLYMMLDTNVSPKLGDGEGNDDSKDDDENDEDEDEEEQESTVMKFLPEDTTALDAMYQAMSQCQALNPDPNDSDSDPENIFVDADGDEGIEGEGQEGHEVGGDDDDGYEYEEANNGNGHTENDAMEVDAAQFEDADSDIDN